MQEMKMDNGKNIGLWSAISIGVGGMVGAGIFSILGTACEMAGNAVYISFSIAGIVALFSTYSYAKLGVKYPSAGGPVEFLVRGFGDGILSGGFNILMWVGYVFALALYARAFAAYFMTFFSNASQAVGRSELFIVSVKVGILVFFATVGFFFIKPGLLSSSQWPPINNIFLLQQ